MRYILLMVVVLAVGACSVGLSSRALVQISTADGLRWLPAEEVDRYGCEASLLVCESSGRLAERLCRCIAP
jgi:hypothetical protein